MGTANGALKADADRVQADGRRVVDDLSRAADHARDLFPEFARQARELFDDSLERLRGQVREGGKEAKDVAGEQLESARLYVVDRVQERPLTVTLAALGVGVLVGLLFASGSRR